MFWPGGFLIKGKAMSEHEAHRFYETLRKYPKTAAGWNQYIRDNVARKRVARALGLVLPSSTEHLLAIRYWRQTWSR